MRTDLRRRSALLWLLAFTGLANAAGDDAHLVLVSIDGFRHDYVDRFELPALRGLAVGGVRADSLRPVWPTLTFPNHYSIATGQYPAEHGIVGNRFPDESRGRWYEYKDRNTVQDGSWYGGEPVWVAAERAGLGSAAFYFVGTEAAIDGVAPGDWRAFDEDVPGEARVAQALDWLRLEPAERPRLITLYFEHVDVASHRHGPGSPESVAAMRAVDGWIGTLIAGIDTSPVADRTTVIVVSDHGQVPTRTESAPFVIADHVDLDGIGVVPHGAVTMLYLPGRDAVRATAIRDAINAAWAHGRAWLPAEAPRSWRVDGNPRFGDVILQADPGHVALPRRDGDVHITAGDHGWAPSATGMHGIFIARGPRLPGGLRLGTIDAVDVYPLMLAILGLPDRRPLRHESPLPALLE